MVTKVSWTGLSLTSAGFRFPGVPVFITPKHRSALTDGTNNRDAGQRVLTSQETSFENGELLTLEFKKEPSCEFCKRLFGGTFGW
jgi:hypothetical protein